MKRRIGPVVPRQLVGCLLPVETKKHLREMADRLEMSVSELVETAIVEKLTRLEAPGGGHE